MLFAKKKTVNLKITGMHCEKCAAKVENAIKALGGSAKIDLKLGRAEVKVPEKIGEAEIKAAVDALGFKAEVI